MLEVKFGDLVREYREIQSEIDQAVLRVLASGWFVLGTELARFEKAFARYCKVGGAVGVASGTEALALALLACDVGPGDEVLTVAHTAVPTVTAISMIGAVPKLVDCRADTCLMDVDLVERAVSIRTKAIVPVHLYGQCVDMDPLLEIGRQYGIPIVEDCAQATGATYRGRPAGTIGSMGCFSFYPSKNIGCYGDGGAVLAKDGKFLERLKMLRNYGQKRRYHHQMLGLNSRLDEIQAAILSVKLPYLDQWNARRCELAARYDAGLRALPLSPVPIDRNGNHVFHLYVVRTANRDYLQKSLEACGVQTLIHYPIPIHLQEAYRYLGYSRGDFPVAEEVAGHIISLPLYPQLPEEEQDYVIASIRSCCPA